MIYLIIASVCIMLASLAGVLATWKYAGTFIEKNLSFLVSFSAGVFLIVSYQLGIEVFELAETPAYGLAWIVAGAVLLGFMFRLVPAFHHHHDEECDHEHSHSIDTRRIVIGDAIHNIGDGILLAATFAISVPLGIATAASVFVHEFVQEVSEFFVLRQAGASIREALKINFLASATILIGSIGGYVLLDQFVALEVPLLGIATGSFLVVVLYDLIPHSVRASRYHAAYGKHIVWFFIGVVVMFGVNQFGVHAHGGDHDDDHDHHEEHDHDTHDTLHHDHDEVESEDARLHE